MGNDSKSKNSFLEGGTMSHPVNTEIIDDYKPRKNKNFKSVQSALNKIKKVDNKIELLNDKKSDIKKPFYRYI